MQRTAEIQQLLEKYLGNGMTVAERARFKAMLQNNANQQALSGMIEKVLEEDRYQENFGFDKKQLFESIMEEAIARESRRAPVHRIHFLKTAWFRYAAAVVVLIGVGAYFFLSPEHSRRKGVASIERSRDTDKTAGSNKAILTLADGSQIILDDKATGNIAQQGGTRIIKLDGNQLSYNTINGVGSGSKTSLLIKDRAVLDPREAGQKPGEVSYNTITTPRGSQYQVILPDGSKVWLNAASSIKFPTVFTGKERKVEVMGEAYFEVAKNLQQIFSVKVNNQPDIIVIGTSFNVNAYQEAENYKTSLLQGAIKINNQLLKPGQAYKEGRVVTTDLDQDIAWKNGLFNFNNLPLKQAMNQLARWYDVEIVYEGELPRYGFSGKMGRDLSLSQVLKGLEDLADVNLRLEGKKLIVTNK